jgi:hypothetical protein
MAKGPDPSLDNKCCTGSATSYSAFSAAMYAATSTNRGRVNLAILPMRDAGFFVQK